MATVPTIELDQPTAQVILYALDCRIQGEADSRWLPVAELPGHAAAARNLLVAIACHYPDLVVLYQRLYSQFMVGPAWE